MGHLPHRPSAFAVGRLDLLWREALHCGTQGGGSVRDVVDESLSLLLVRRAFEGKFSDGITWIAHTFLHDTNRRLEKLQKSNGERGQGEISETNTVNPNFSTKKIKRLSFRGITAIASSS